MRLHPFLRVLIVSRKRGDISIDFEDEPTAIALRHQGQAGVNDDWRTITPSMVKGNNPDAVARKRAFQMIHSAVMCGGVAGFMLGTTANAMAVMRSLVERYGPAHRAFLVARLVGAFFLDFTNALIITLFLNVLR